VGSAFFMSVYVRKFPLFAVFFRSHGISSSSSGAEAVVINAVFAVHKKGVGEFPAFPAPIKRAAMARYARP